MRIPVRELTVGDIFRLNDWQMHVIAVEHDLATAVLTSEFGFLLHFTRDETVDIVGDVVRERRRGVTRATEQAETPPRGDRTCRPAAKPTWTSEVRSPWSVSMASRH